MLRATRRASTFRLNSSTDPGKETPDRVTVGYVKRPHGVKGAVLVALRTDDPDRFVPGAMLGTDRAPSTVRVRAVQAHKEGVILSLVGIEDRTSAEGLRGMALLITRDERRPLGRDEFWPEDLVGLEARDPAGMRLGRVVDVVVTGVQDRLVVDGPDRPVEVPFVAQLVPIVDLEAGYIIVNPPEGLFPESG